MPPVRALEKGCSMSTGFAASSTVMNWRELYKVALFETDKNKVPERIAQAEWALVLRARELFHTNSEHLREREVVDAAIYALHILRDATTIGRSRKAVQAS